MAVCLNRFLYKLKVGALLVSNKNSHYIHSKKKERTFVHPFLIIYDFHLDTRLLKSLCFQTYYFDHKRCSKQQAVFPDLRVASFFGQT